MTARYDRPFIGPIHDPSWRGPDPDLARRLLRAERGDAAPAKRRKATKPRTLPARVHVPKLMAPGAYVYAIELYAFRHKARESELYAQADATSQVINVSGLKRRAQLEKQGRLRPWNTKE
jgi:hypothetical protein